MPCLFAMFAGFFPRLGTLFIWIARPVMFNAAFGGSWLWPILGIIFLPFTTLMYVILLDAGDRVDHLGLVLAGDGSGDRPDALEQHGVFQPQSDPRLYSHPHHSHQFQPNVSIAFPSSSG